MESLAKLREKVSQVLQAQITGYLMDTLQDQLIQSVDLNRFLVVRTGWHQDADYYALIQDVEIRKDKTVIIYADNTDTDLATDLLEAGIPASRIKKAYIPSQKEQLKQAATSAAEYRQVA